MWYNVNWDVLGQTLMPEWWRKYRFVALMRVLLSGVVQRHSVFLATRSKVIYDMTVTGQTMSLENALNDRFDELRRIYIENLTDLTQLYLYNKVEAQPPLYLYNKWNPAVPYEVGQFAVTNTGVWICTNDHTDELPGLGSGFWAYHKERVFLINKGEALQPTDFIVWVPISLVFDNDEMRALIRRFKLASKRYLIMTF